MEEEESKKTGYDDNEEHRNNTNIVASHLAAAAVATAANPYARETQSTPSSLYVSTDMAEESSYIRPPPGPRRICGRERFLLVDGTI